MLNLRFGPDELERVHAQLTNFIAATVHDAGADGAVLGLSGGIDSTLTAHLAVDALGPDRVKGLILPSGITAADNVEDAESVADGLGMAAATVDIEPIVDAVVEAYPEATDDQLAVGNARARIRAVLNYVAANHENRVVLGTGNRSEAAVGYFTKYGDGAVDCHPIGDLYKMQVRQLADHVGVREALIEKTPTAELWAEQTDEDELGVDYDTLDAILALHVDGPLSKAATVRELDCDPSVIDRVVSLNETSDHKRSMPPSPTIW